MSPKQPAAPELVEVRIARSWIQAIVACQGQANIMLHTKIINGQPTDSYFTDPHLRFDLSHPSFAVIEIPSEKPKRAAGKKGA
jgi:hypothetical protein